MSTIPTAPTPRARRRWPLYAVAAFGALIVGLVVGTLWLVATPGGARVVLDRVAIALGKGTTVTGVDRKSVV